MLPRTALLVLFSTLLFGTLVCGLTIDVSVAQELSLDGDFDNANVVEASWLSKSEVSEIFRFRQTALGKVLSTIAGILFISAIGAALLSRIKVAIWLFGFSAAIPVGRAFVSLFFGTGYFFVT